MSDDPTTYSATRDRLVGHLERLRHYAIRVGIEADAITEIDRVLTRTRSGSFVIAVVGEFNRGKSTFINALLRRPVLPADALPATATVNRVRYGPRPIAHVVYRATDDAPERVEQIEVDHLRAYVTKLTEESEERARHVKQAEIYVPLPFLEQNEIIDTPGLNDDISMTDVTYGILPEADAAIMIVVPQAPFGQTEEEFLNHLLNQDIGRVMFVVNRIDQVRRPADRERAIAGIRERIQESTRRRAEALYGDNPVAFERYQRRIGGIQVFGLSAREALEAWQTEDSARLEASGFLAFEHALRQFLEQQRGAIRLRILADRVIGSAALVSAALTVRLGALEMSQQEFHAAYVESVRQLDELLQRVNAQVARIDDVAERVQRIADAQVDGLNTTLKRIADTLIDQEPMSTEDLEPSALKVYSRNLRMKILAELQVAGRNVADRLQNVISAEVEVEAERLGALAEIIGADLLQVSARFAQTSSGEGQMQDTLPLAGVGGNDRLLGSLVMRFPHVSLVISMVNALGGAWLTRKLGGNAQIKHFKAESCAAVHSSIDQQLGESGAVLRAQFSQHVTATFHALKAQAHSEIGTHIEQLRHTVDTLRIERERGQMRAELEQEDAAVMHAELRSMLDDARTVAGSAEHMLEGEN